MGTKKKWHGAAFVFAAHTSAAAPVYEQPSYNYLPWADPLLVFRAKYSLLRRPLMQAQIYDNASSV